MAIRIECSECQKRIVIDDAFAGGACRCPFCSQIVMVPGGEGEPTSQRPDSPSERPESPERPGEPGSRPTEQAGKSAPADPKPESKPKPKPAIDPKTVPMARKDRTMAYVMFGAVAVLAVAVVVGLVFAFAGGPGTIPTGPGGGTAANSPDEFIDYDPPVGKDPFKSIVQGPAIAGDVSLVTPVVYIIDGGEGMREVFDSAVAITSVSMSTLRPVDKFAVIISANAEITTDAGKPPLPFEAASATPRRAPTTRPVAAPSDESTEANEPVEPSVVSAEAPADTLVARAAGKDLYLPGGWLGGGPQSEQAFQKWVRDYQERDLAPRGLTDILASIDAAIALKPRNIVVFTLKDLVEGGQLIPQAADVAAKAKANGVPIIAIGLHKGSGVNDQVKGGLEKFSTASGAEARNYGFDRLTEWANEYYNRMDE